MTPELIKEKLNSLHHCLAEVNQLIVDLKTNDVEIVIGNHDKKLCVLLAKQTKVYVDNYDDFRGTSFRYD